VVNNKKPPGEALGKVPESYEIDSLLAVRPRGSTKQTEDRRGAGLSTAKPNAKATIEPETQSARRIENQERQIVNLKKRMGGNDLWQGAKRMRAPKGGGKGKVNGKAKGKGKEKGKKGNGKGKNKVKGKSNKGKFDKGTD
jgi:hypothetical protein